jgi:glycosyltransferase involved in cell wall biosynthesis
LATISICIPAYKRTNYLKRLLESISVQSYRDFEVIITDDSPDDSVKNLALLYSDNFLLRYFKNSTPLGTPANWNCGIALAKGEWIKLIHDDDWFAAKDSLALFAKETATGKKFIFSAYNNVFEKNDSIEQKFFPKLWKKRILKEPVLLLNTNVIGPPSVTIIHKSIKEHYDCAMKWRVDIDFYIRLLKKEKEVGYIGKSLINVGISESQVTNSCINKPEVELPEGLLLLKKYGVRPLKNICIYDAWWRIIRNVNVRSLSDLSQYTFNQQWPVIIIKMVTLQIQLPKSILKIGIFSKLFMSLSYLLNQRYLNQYK